MPWCRIHLHSSYKLVFVLPTGLARAVAKDLNWVNIEVKIEWDGHVSVVQIVSQVFRSAGCPKYLGPKIAVRKSLALTVPVISRLFMCL